MVSELCLNEAVKKNSPQGILHPVMRRIQTCQILHVWPSLKSYHTPTPVHFPQQAIVLEVTLMDGFALIS